MRRVIYILVFVALSVSVATGQSMVGSNSGVVTVHQVLNISVATTGTLPTLSTAGDYINGKTVNGFATVSIKANVNWILSVRSTTSNFTPMSSGASTNMPANKLGLKKSSSSTYLTLSTSNQTLAMGNKGNSTASGNTFTTDIKFHPGFGYGGGLYRLVLTYTITNQ